MTEEQINIAVKAVGGMIGDPSLSSEEKICIRMFLSEFGRMKRFKRDILDDVKNYWENE